MGDTSIKKVSAKYSPKGAMGQTYLVSGVHLSMRLWEAEPAGVLKPHTQRDYETVGYVISGRAELHLEGQKVVLEPGASWLVPKGAVHTYVILEPFTAIEATYPPAQVPDFSDPFVRLVFMRLSRLPPVKGILIQGLQSLQNASNASN